MSERNVTIGMLKAMPEKWDVERNFAVFEEQFRIHAERGLDVFLTPECFLDGYAVTEDDWTIERFAEVAQEVDNSAYIQMVCNLARESETSIVFGFTELLDGYFYNCALIVNGEGEVLGKYHKTHLQKHDHRFAPGEDLPVFDLPFGRVGTVICADRRWPESIRAIRLKGAEICLMPTYGMSHEKNEWWMRTRSYENQMFVCFAHPGVALITDPGGDVAAKLASNQPGVLVHEVDLSQVTDDNHLANRRPGLYDILADKNHVSQQDEYVPPRVADVRIG